MVSVIVPVYNTSKYLEKCIQSILFQTYTDLEIILINDGSTDNSLQILKKYQTLDGRVRVITVKNGGLGRARNIGIEQARGKFIMFVDSDDWISENCVEILYRTLENEQCDIVIGDIAKTYFEKEETEKIIGQDIPFSIDRENKIETLFKIPSYSVAKLIRKELFFKYGIFFPLHCFEDIATLPLIYAVAGKIYYQKEVVYYYRNRAGSIVNSMDYIYDRIKCVSTLENGLKRLGLYEEYRQEFLRFVRQRSRVNQRVVRELLDRQYQEFERRQLIFDYQILEKFENKAGLKVCVYGSYNLMIAAKIFLRLRNEEHVPNYFGFQNIISSMSPKSEILDVLVPGLLTLNSFRKTALVQDFEKILFYQKPEQFDGIDYFILDFLEERYDTGCIGDTCFTMSDAFLDLKSLVDLDYDVLKSFSTEWFPIWQKKCDLFIRFMRETIGNGKIILVKTKLSEKYGQSSERYLFDNAVSIRNENEHLEECYDYFVRHCPEAVVVEVEKLESYFTDKEFRHGCFPWHLNENAYREIAGEMKKAADYQKYKELISQESAVSANGI